MMIESSNDTTDNIIIRYKQNIRQRILSIRKILSNEFVEEASHCIFDNFVKMNLNFRCGIVMLYMNINNEVSTEEFADFFLTQGATLCLPRICDDKGNMEARRVESIDKDLEQNALKIKEPNIKTQIVDPQQIDIIFVPGVAFDTSKNRIGHGKGYYDRFLAKLRPDCFKIGLAYDFQILESIPAGIHDVPMDFIITEKRVF